MENLKDKIINNRYRIEHVIGVGGMAVVYSAIDLSTNTRVAVKVLKDEFLESSTSKKRFVSESKIIEMLSHENIVKIYNVGFNDDLYYIVMEYVDGISLKQYIDQEGRLTLNESIYFMTQVAKALAHAHSKGVVHRDIKPQNIMLLRDGSVKVMDFGIAKYAKSATLTLHDKAIGSVHYISPEQVNGQKCDARSDIYSAGITFYEMLTGKVPFDADTPVSVALKQIKELPRAPKSIFEDIPSSVNEIILRAISKRPEDRYQTADALLEDLQRVKRDTSITFGYNIKFLVESKNPNLDERPTEVLEVVPQGKSTGRNWFNSLTQNQKIWMIIGSVTLTLAILTFTALGIFGTVFSKDVKVPDLSGKHISEVINGDEYPYFEIEIAGEQYSDKYAKGEILKQTPEDGLTVKKGCEISVWVSLGKELIKIPDVKNTASSAALIRLSSLGFVCTLESEYNASVPKGEVIKTLPEIGAEIEKGSSVTVYVSKGANEVSGEAPAVTGSQTLVIPLPQQTGVFKLSVYQDKNLVYSASHSSEERNPTVDVYGSGTSGIEVTVNDVQYLAYTITFN